MSEKKEYIERGALLLAIGEERAVMNGLSEYGYLKVIREVPAADVERVVRGEWMWKTTKEAEAFAPLGIVLGTENYICSECKKYLHRESMRNPLPKYCDECGAKMGLPGKERER